MTYRHPANLIASKSILACLLPLLTLCALPFAAHAQSATATLRGAVVDENGETLPAVEITVLNEATSLKREASTNDSGNFTVPLLPPGKYTLTAMRNGFRTVFVGDIMLNVNDERSLRIRLTVGDVKEAVNITGDAGLINDSPSVATVIDRQFVANLPLNGRTAQPLILLAPGVVVTRSASFSGSSAGQFSVNGQRQNANYFTVDGVGANIGVVPLQYGFSEALAGTIPALTAFGGTNNLVSIDALEEFKIQTSTYAAKFGRQPGGQVQLVTRSGDNQFHGSIFDYLRNDALDARNWFANYYNLPKAPLRQNQFGGTLSGPVALPRFGEGGKSYWSGRNHTFFFFSYEGQRLRLPTTTTTEVPSLRIRQEAAPAVKPFLNAFPLPTGPETLTSDGEPSGSAPFSAAYSSPSAMDSTSIRIDHRIGSKLAFFGRYNYAPSNNLSRNLNALSGAAALTRTLTLGLTTSPTPQLNNEFRFNTSTSRGRSIRAMDDFGGAIPVTLSSLISGYSGTGVKQGSVSFYASSFLGSYNLGDDVDSFQRQINIVDNLEWSKKGHSFSFGIDYRRLAPIYGPVEYVQAVDFLSEADISSETAGRVSIFASQGARPLFTNFSAYAQDHWKASTRLTLDLGLRWELNPAPHEAQGRKPTLVTGIDNLATATLAPADAPFYKTFYTAFAPRVGMAYQLSQKGGRETVLRGGFGVFYDLGSGQVTNGYSGYPFGIYAPDITNVPFPISSQLAAPPAIPTVTWPLPDIQVIALNPALKTPYTLEWNLTLEQSLGKNQIISLAYIGSAARRLIMTQSLNYHVGDPITGPRPNANVGIISYVTNGPTSDYHSLQAGYQTRLARGLQALINYTWSHAIDQVSNESDNITLARGNASFDVRHNFSSAITYDIPALRQAPILTPLLRDWSISASVKAQTAQPIDLIAGYLILPGDGRNIQVRPDVAPGVPYFIKDPTVPGGRRLNFAAFRSPPFNPDDPSQFTLARQGTLGRNVVRGHGFTELAIAIQREVKLGERLKLLMKAEAFNPFNHPQFGLPETLYIFDGGNPLPDADVSSRQSLNDTLGGLGSLYQIGGPRSIQLTMRFSF